MTGVLVERRDRVVELTLDRPDCYNAFSASLTEALLSEVDAAHHTPTDLLVFRGAGPGFSAGFDLQDLNRQSDGDLLHRFVRLEQLFQAVHRAPFTTLALAHGVAFGAAADLVCACDLRVGAPGVRFRIPGLRFGIVLGTRRLAERVGADRARAIQSTAALVDAESAVRMGLLTAVEPVDRWERVVHDAPRTTHLGGPARAAFRDALAPDHGDADLAALVKSATVPGLRSRMLDFHANGKDRS